MPEAPPTFRFSYPVQVRFRDLDPMGHAHHSLPLVYFEEARAAYWRDVVGRSGIEDISYIMAEFTVRYLARIRFPQTLQVRARVARVGRKSWNMEYELQSPAGELLATGRSVQVMYDYAVGETIEIPEDVRGRIEAFENQAQPGSG